MGLKSSSEKLAETLSAGTSEAERVASVQAIVIGVAHRLFAAIDSGMTAVSEVLQRGEKKLTRSWENLAIKGIKEIEAAGSLAPGLSHQEIYVRELEAARKAATTSAEFLEALERLKAKWGSRLKYPLYAGGRKKQLEDLAHGLQQSLADEERRVRETLDRSLAVEIERVSAEANERINYAAVELRGVLIDALAWPKPEEQVILLRWLIIGTMTDALFEKLSEHYGEENVQYRTFLYFALERIMRTVYESFQHEVSRGPRAAGASGAARNSLASLIDHEIQHCRRAAAEFEAKLASQRLTGPIIAAIRNSLKSGKDPIKADAKLFAEICSGLRGDRTFEQFEHHLRKVSGLDGAGREEVIAAVKTAVEPFRSLYYVKINYVRYMKGLKKFRESI